ncbi:MAG: hypothetical protein GY932_09550 [Arcobacter sp.]|nr:hypothetical protein [Arcobacter sp.]
MKTKIAKNNPKNQTSNYNFPVIVIVIAIIVIVSFLVYYFIIKDNETDEGEKGTKKLNPKNVTLEDLNDKLNELKIRTDNYPDYLYARWFAKTYVKDSGNTDAEFNIQIDSFYKTNNLVVFDNDTKVRLNEDKIYRVTIQPNGRNLDSLGDYIEFTAYDSLGNDLGFTFAHYDEKRNGYYRNAGPIIFIYDTTGLSIQEREIGLRMKIVGESTARSRISFNEVGSITINEIK